MSKGQGSRSNMASAGKTFHIVMDWNLKCKAESAERRRYEGGKCQIREYLHCIKHGHPTYLDTLGPAFCIDLAMYILT